MTSEQLTTKQQLGYVGIGVLIGVAYTVLFAVFFDWIENEEIKFSIIPEAEAQVQPFELQLEQIRDPEACTRKVIQSTSAHIPFTLKVFYDTTTDRKWDSISKTETFPVAQQTAQVATFFTQEIDQYQQYLEINYDRPAHRQVYIEILSEGRLVTNWQEKFDDQKFCMTFFINTNEPPTFPTRQELIGDLLTNVDRIPEMITSFNINTVTWNTSISYMWTLIFGSIVVSVMTLISTAVVNRNVKSRIKDFDEAIELVDQTAQKVDELADPLEEIIKNQKEILKKSPQPIEPEKKSKFKKMISKKKDKEKPKKKGRGFFGLFRSKDQDEDEIYEEEEEQVVEVPPKETKVKNAKLVKEIENIEQENIVPKTESQEVLEALQPTAEEIQEERELSGGFIQASKEEKVSPPPPLPKEEIPPVEEKPPKFKEILRSIDFEENSFKEGHFDKFTYNELNAMYGWIVHYKKRKLMTGEWENVPEEVRTKQDIAEKIIYHAIFAKMDRKMKNGK